jgi:hypothetical protein
MCVISIKSEVDIMFPKYEYVLKEMCNDLRINSQSVSQHRYPVQTFIGFFEELKLLTKNRNIASTNLDSHTILRTVVNGDDMQMSEALNHGDGSSIEENAAPVPRTRHHGII